MAAANEHARVALNAGMLDVTLALTASLVLFIVREQGGGPYGVEALILRGVAIAMVLRSAAYLARALMEGLRNAPYRGQWPACLTGFSLSLVFSSVLVNAAAIGHGQG